MPSGVTCGDVIGKAKLARSLKGIYRYKFSSVAECRHFGFTDTVNDLINARGVY